MKHTPTLFLKLLCALGLFYTSQANADIRLSFNRTGNNANSVKVFVTDENGNPIKGASATLTSSHSLMANKGAVNEKIVCPNVNGNTNPKIKLTFNIKGLPAAQQYQYVGLDIHALNSGGNYQNNDDTTGRKFNVKTQVGKNAGSLETFGNLNDIDIAAGVGESGNVHTMWEMKSEKAFTAEGDYQIVLDITTGSANKGCFFGLSEIALSNDQINVPEKVIPFKTSSAIGHADACYAITSQSDKYLTMTEEGDLKWADASDNEDQIWYFVESGTGYFIINVKNHRVYSVTEQNTVWNLLENAEGSGFSFIPAESQEDMNTKLTIDGESVFLFHSVHNAFARANQIYEIPCGNLGSNYITRLSVEGDVLKPMSYPLAIIENGNVIQPEGQQPESEHYIYTEDKAIVTAGNNMNLKIQLNAAPIEGLEGFVHFDWNRDGIYETSQAITLAKECNVKVTVPAEAKAGKTRVRIRLTENGMNKGDDEVIGQIFDWILYVTDAAPESYIVKAIPNDTCRGMVTISKENGWNVPCEVKAVTKGNSTFICWREGLQVVSVDKDYKFTINHNTNLMAFFSPNTQGESTGIEQNLNEENHLISVATENHYIKVQTCAKVIKILVFTPSGKLIAQSDKDTVHLAGAPTGTYIVKVYTDSIDKTAKVLLK